MRFLTALRLGLRRAHRHPGLIVLAWLAALVPALLIASIAWQDLSEAMSHSPFAGTALEGNRSGVWTDFSASEAYDLAPVSAGLGLRFLLVVLLQALVSAGIVETLLVDAPQATRPFLLGIGRHGWRFLRTLLWFGLTVAVLAVLSGAFFGAAMDFSEEAADANLHVWGLVIGVVLTALLFAFLDLGHDLARIASAAHYDPRTFKGYFLAVGHAFRHPILLLPLWSTFALLGLAAHAGYLALRAAWSPGSLGAVILLLVTGQILMLFHAWLRVGLWGSLVAYYQGIGEPRWCIRGRRPRSAATTPVAGLPSRPAAEPVAEPVAGAPPADPETERTIGISRSGPAPSETAPETADQSAPEPVPAPPHEAASATGMGWAEPAAEGAQATAEEPADHPQPADPAGAAPAPTAAPVSGTPSAAGLPPSGAAPARPEPLESEPGTGADREPPKP